MNTASHQMATLNDRIARVVSLFEFEKPTKIVGKSNPEDVYPDDEDIYDGTIVTTNSFARVARHKPTGALCLIGSKSPLNLRGERLEDGRIQATREGLQASYIITAFREEKGLERKLASHMRRELTTFSESLGERSEKHFTLFGGRQVDPKTGEADQNREIFTNGRIAYLLEKTKRGYNVRLYAPVLRRDGSFVPVSLVGGKLRDRFTQVSRIVARTDSYAAARHQMAEHWQKMSSRLWDEQSIYKGEGFGMNVKRQLATLFNTIVDSKQTAIVTALVGGLVYLKDPALGLVGGVAYAAAHTGVHMLLDEGFQSSYEAYKRVKEAKQRLTIDAYPKGADVADHFKVQNRNNISRVCPKMDLERFSPEEFEFLDAEASGMVRDHDERVDGFTPGLLHGHVVAAHMRGFSSSCSMPDQKSRLDIFQTGLIRFMTEREDGKIIAFGRYRDDVCMRDYLKMPEAYKNQFDDGVMRIEYDPKAENYYEAFKVEHLGNDLTPVMDEISSLLFADQPDVDQEVKARSVAAVFEAFQHPEDPVPDMFMSGKPSVLPDLRAVL